MYLEVVLLGYVEATFLEDEYNIRVKSSGSAFWRNYQVTKICRS